MIKYNIDYNGKLIKIDTILTEMCHRPDHTPVVLARNLGRDGEAVRTVDLAALDVDDVDMLTVVIVGSSQTRRVGDWVYTPRGYDAKEPRQ